ncbi:NAD(P)H-dependent oxidoreductase [Hymenobacter sp. BT683]|uniref:NAD(P)H-dependent oxidoreductase n=1 Tax=Hymenobacter jeongseonensis TaxID=2791027 RepID=A0ABS0IKN4_9BACT|nr:NAD(P)H-dependent oxidoreductase [Hymenobacter jeongseonensis]MBF9238901.1 NAD(P)H-dependent oxidoreductase [Hymenobacter jeongseonensis]
MSDSARRFLFLLSSTRRLGNSEQLAYCAAHPLPAQTGQRWLHLSDHALPEFVDLRHTGAFHAPTGNAQLLLEATLDATDVVLAAPLYLYSLPAAAKHYLDYWNAWLRTPNIAFSEQMQGKTLWAIIVSSGKRDEAKPLEATLRLTAQFMDMRWGGMLYGTGSRPNDIQQDAAALKQAQTFFLNPATT